MLKLKSIQFSARWWLCTNSCLWPCYAHCFTNQFVWWAPVQIHNVQWDAYKQSSRHCEYW